MCGAALLSLAVLVPAGAAGGSSATVDVAPGLRYEQVREHELTAHVARIAPDAVHRLRPVPAGGVVGDTDPGRPAQATSDLCRQAGGIICVNADFAACPTCRSPYGGVVVGGEVLRTPAPGHEQLTLTDRGPTTGALRWGGHVRADYVWLAPVERPNPFGGAPERVEIRRERRQLPIAGVNIPPVGDGTVVYTRAWGGPTPSRGDTLELVLRAGKGLVPGSQPVDVALRRLGGGLIPDGTVVLAATGRARDELWALSEEWQRWSNATERSLVLETATTIAARHSVGGHPVLLRQGRTQSWPGDDPKARGRHPRTLLGWTPSGEVLLVVVDGRRPGHSGGLTLHESADLLRRLGATEAINLDGGGSSTFVGPCPTGACVLNRPSDDRERLVPVALAVVGDGRPVRPVPPPGGPPVAPPAPPTGVDAASVAHALPPPPPSAPAASASPSQAEVASPPIPAPAATTYRPSLRPPTRIDLGAPVPIRPRDEGGGRPWWPSGLAIVGVAAAWTGLRRARPRAGGTTDPARGGGAAPPRRGARR